MSLKITSLLDVLKPQEKLAMGVEGDSLNVGLTFTKRTVAGQSVVTFQEYPFMNSAARPTKDSLIPRCGLGLLTEGKTSISVDLSGEVVVLVNGRAKPMDMFANALLKDHLTAGLNFRGSVLRLAEEFEIVMGIPMEQHEMMCDVIVKKFLKMTHRAGETITSGADVRFALVSMETKQAVTKIAVGKSHISAGMLLTGADASYMFYPTWAMVFQAAYKKIIEHIFCDVARRTLGPLTEGLPPIFDTFVRADLDQ